MQGDLISRSEFKKKLIDYNRHLIAREEKATEEEDYEELNAICYERRAYFMLLSFLDDMPCAFDVEAVVAELENLKEHGLKCEDCSFHDETDCYGLCSKGKIARAIEIVRGKE